MGFRGTLYNIVFHYSQFYFVTIAVTLNTGVLGLPTTLADSGFLPFLITIFASYITQVLTVIFFTGTLQKAYYRSVDKLKETNKDNVPLQLQQKNEFPTYGSQDGSTAKPADNSEPIQRYLPNWHSLGELYLPYFFSYLCTLNMVALLVVFAISYILAGGQSFAVLTGVSFYQIAPIFAWILTAVLLVFDAIISPIISVLTILKGLLFTSIIIITFIVGLQHQIPTKSDFSHTGDTLLMGLVALAGIVSVMPLMFRQVKQTKTGIIGFNISIILALTTSLILYIIWCWSVLAIVPQHSVCLPNDNTKTTQIPLSLFNESQGQCVKSPSLENAAANGQIATIPLSMILRTEQNSVAHYLSIIIQAFVATTVSVAFIITGSILYHTLNGVVNSFLSSSSAYETRYDGFFKYITVHTIRQWFVALIIFLLIFAIAFCNPKSFNVFVQQAGSLFVAVQFGIFQAMMTHRATYSSEFRSYELSLQIPRWFFPLQYLIPLYYICCIGYNIYMTVTLLIKD